jgi:serine/threonine protein kinase
VHGARADAHRETETTQGPTPRPTLRPGTRLEGNLICILESIDAGGMGEVYLAWHEVLNAEVVVKVAQAPEMEARFRHEIEIQNWLGSHPHIVAVKTAGRFGDRSYLMMEYVPGLDLNRYAKERGPLPWREACGYIRQVAMGLAHAHSKGVVHRDLKPSNLIRSEADGLVKILDWGLARRSGRPSPDEDMQLTRPGIIPGTPDYIAPERIGDPETIGPASDLYSLGCTFFELLTGHPPFHEHSNKLQAHLQEPVPALPAQLGVPPDVDRVLRRLLSKRAEDRYHSAQDFVKALDAALEAPGVPHTRRGNWHHVALVLGSIVTVAGFVAISPPWHWGREEATGPGGDRSFQGEDVVAPNSLTGALTIEVWRDKQFLGDARWMLPLETGDQLVINADLPRGLKAALLWYDTEGRLVELGPMKVSPGQVTDRWIYPADGVAPLEGPPGTELVLVCASRGAPVSRDELAGALGMGKPLPALPPDVSIVLNREGVQIRKVRGLGEAEPSESTAIRDTLDRLRLKLRDRYILFEGLAFFHRSPVGRRREAAGG